MLVIGQSEVMVVVFVLVDRVMSVVNVMVILSVVVPPLVVNSWREWVSVSLVLWLLCLYTVWVLWVV